MTVRDYLVTRRGSNSIRLSAEVPESCLTWDQGPSVFGNKANRAALIPGWSGSTSGLCSTSSSVWSDPLSLYEIKRTFISSPCSSVPPFTSKWVPGGAQGSSLHLFPAQKHVCLCPVDSEEESAVQFHAEAVSPSPSGSWYSRCWVPAGP